MRKRALFSLVGALIAAVALVSASGAATTTTPRLTRIDVSTRAAVIHYLHSIHIKAKGAVIERGLHNYAGARCPGKHWTCVSTKHTVVQIAKPGGQNRFMCRSSHCVVVQFSGTAHGVFMTRQGASTAAGTKTGSTAYCVKTGSGATSGTGQSCAISQLGSGPNLAGVYENTSKVSGLVQTAQYTASITQQSTGSNNNTACVTQSINLDGSTTNTNGKTTTGNLQAHQSILISQDNNGTGTGINRATNSAQYAADSTGHCTTSDLTQSQTLTSTITATGQIVQQENAAYSACGDGAPGDYANLCLKIDQNQGLQCTGTGTGQTCPSSATNNASFTQNSTQAAVANATKGAAVTQTQSTPLCGTSGSPTPPPDCVAPGGLVGTINQDSSGVSTATPTQNEVQCEDAATSGLSVAASCLPTATPPDNAGLSSLSQTQYGPVGVGNLAKKQQGHVHFSHLKGLGQAAQHGNPYDQYTISQNSTQNADLGAIQLNLGQADCHTDGACTASQTTTVNGTPTSDGYTAPSIGNLNITCDPTQNNGQCKGTPPPAPVITEHPDDPSTSRSATFTWTEAATAGVTLKCSIDGGTTFSTCDSATTTSYSGLSLGDHTFEVKAVDNTASHNASAPASFSWAIIPYLSFEASSDGASGWSNGPGSPIDLTTGSDIPNTFAQITLHNFEGIALSDLVGAPTFATDNYAAGSPRYYITLSGGNSLWGYPPNSGLNGSDFAWAINNGNTYQSWSAVQSAESTATVTGVYVIADGDQPSTTDVITGLTFDGYTFN